MSFGFGFALPAYPLRGGGGNNPFNQLGPTLDLSFTGVVTDLTNPNGYTLNTDFIIPQYQIGVQYAIWETGVGLVDKTFSQIITFTRASTATYFDSAGVLQSAAINTPRFDYDPATLAARGFLIEEARTNSIRNNTMQGAVAGTPGTLPTNWTVTTSSGTTTNVVAVGSVAGITYVDLQVTTSGANTTGTAYVLAIEAASQIAALNGQTWTGSFWWSLVGGDFANVTAAFFDIVELDSGGSQVTSGATSVSLPTATFTRFPVTRTNSNAATAFVRPRFRFTVTNGVPVDFTLRIGLPQLELGAFATSVIPTTTTALTRSADVAAVNTLSPWYNATEGTVYAEVGYQQTNPSSAQHAASFNDTTPDNRWTASFTGTTALGSALRNTGGVGLLTTNTANAATVGATNKIALAISTGASVVLNGGTVATNASYAAPTVTRLELGRQLSVGYFNGHLRRIAYYPRRLSNAELQALTA